MTVRAYLPSSLRRLQQLTATGGIELDPGTPAYAVTDAARAADPGSDEEQLEYAAMATAALDSVTLLGDQEPQRRLVLAVDVEAADPSGDADDPFAVRVSGCRLPADVAAYLLDDAGAEPDVRRGRAAWTDRSPGWEDVVAGTADHELGWYAASELRELLEILTLG